MPLLVLLCFSWLMSSFAQTDIYDSIYTGNVWRKYNIHLPTGYQANKQYPLIFGFHGGQQSATSAQGWTVFAYQSKLSEKADGEGFVVVYPEGLVFNQNRSWNAGNCCPPSMNQNVDDIGFVDNLLDTIISSYSIDSTRIYAVGTSNGGMLCYRLACELSHRFAAIAVNACTQMYLPCNPTNKIPIISFHSKIDPIVNYNGGFGGAAPLTGIYFPSQDSAMNLWFQKNNCRSKDTIINGNGINFDFVKIHDCSCSKEIHHYATTDGSHSWPGGNPNNNPVSTQLSATDLLWSFFQQYALGCFKSEIRNATFEVNSVNGFPNPFFDQISLMNTSGKENCTLMNHFGQVIWTGSNIQEQDFSYLPSGLYYIRIEDRAISVKKQ